jgi:Fe2+ or Zn2+ uptake regulation protein
MDAERDYTAVLAGHGARATPQRRQVWEYFARSRVARSLDEALAALRGRGIGQATLYRVVNLFCRLEMLARVHDAAGRERFVARHAEHCHIVVCQRCGGVGDFHDCDLSLVEKLLALQTGFTVERHRLDFIGVCPACQAHGKGGTRE